MENQQLAEFNIEVRRPESAEDWKTQYDRIRQLYAVEDRTLKQVMQIMEQKYGFKATYVSFSSMSCPRKEYINTNGSPTEENSS